MSTPKNIEWDAKPQPGMSKMTHKFSIIETIEKASSALDTDYTTQVETITVGRVVRAIFCTLPQFIPQGTDDKGLLPAVDGKAKLGVLCNRTVFYDRDHKMDDRFVLSNGKDTVDVVVKNIKEL